tara:strand:- start:872 stop:1009 length:138 start_codon:yes stop_codon:yes gene_type:complete
MKLKFKNLVIKIKCFFCNCMKKQNIDEDKIEIDIDFQSSRKFTNL